MVLAMTNLVNVPVPDSIADEVRRFAAFLIADRDSDPGMPPLVPFDGISDYPLWEDSAIISLANAGTVTSSYYRKIMDAVIEREAVGQWVSLVDLTEWTKEKRSALSTFRTHLYRWIHSHMPEGTIAPFTAASGQDLRPARSREVFYRVSVSCADQWARVQLELEVK